MSFLALSATELSATELSTVETQVAAASIEDKKSTLDSAITKLFAHICCLRTLRNSSVAGISRLPTEILRRIMVAVVQPSPDSDYQAISWNMHVQYTSVSRGWREMLLDCHEYWICVSLLPCKHLKEMVARSGLELPVIVRLDLETCSNSETARAQLAEVLPTLKNRLLEFHFKANAHESFTGPRLWACLPDEAQFLRSLKLHLSNGGPCTPVIPTSVLCFSHPVLQHLALGGCDIDWETLKSIKGSRVGIQNLLSLHLHRIQPPPPRKTLLRILRGSPKLESLHLSQVIPKDFDSPRNTESTSAPIHFPSLVKFHLADDFPLSSTLLEQLRLARDVHFAFVVLEPDHYCAHYQQAFSRKFKKLVPKLLKQYTASINHPDTRGSNLLQIEGHDCGRGACDYASCTLFKWTQGVGSEETFRVHGSVSGLLPMLRNVHAPELKDFQISWDGDSDCKLNPTTQPSEVDWRAFFARHPAIEEISITVVEEFSIFPIIDALSQPTYADSSQYLQKLEVLSFGVVKFDDADFEVLDDFVVSRSYGANPLRYVGFQDCSGLDMGRMRELQAEADETEIIWDGFDDDGEEEDDGD